MVVNQRFKKLISVLSAYANGSFNPRLTISSRYDDMDAIAESINMVGEELKAITISKNYFNNIFQSVTDMVFVLTKTGEITDINKAVIDQLGYPKESLLDKTLDHLQAKGKPSLTKNILRYLRKPNGILSKDFHVQTAKKDLLPVYIGASYLVNSSGQKTGILLIVKDRTAQIQNENQIIRAIIDTQETERQRLARDLHDSLGQELIGIKFCVASIAENCKNAKDKEVLMQSNAALGQVISDMRDICFNLLPRALEDFGLLQGVKELCLQIREVNNVYFDLEIDPSFPGLSKEISVDLFRVIQEFISNAINHGKATRIRMEFKNYLGHIKIYIEGNGRGFNAGKAGTMGMGLQNVQSRVKSHGREVLISSSMGRGTNYQITLPTNH